MRLQRRGPKDARNGTRADEQRLIQVAQVLGQQRRRPVRERKPYIARRLARFGNDLRRLDLGEREGGRPERGASANSSTGLDAFLK